MHEFLIIDRHSRWVEMEKKSMYMRHVEIPSYGGHDDDTIVIIIIIIISISSNISKSSSSSSSHSRSSSSRNISFCKSILYIVEAH